MTFRYQVLVRLALAIASGVLWVATPLCLDWIEVLTRWNLDQHNGSAERLISGGFLVITLIMLLSAAIRIRLISGGFLVTPATMLLSAAIKVRRRSKAAAGAAG